MGFRKGSQVRRAGLALAMAAAFSFVALEAYAARAGRGGSFGSRGSMSQSAPPVTNTAPRQAQPLPGAVTPSQRQPGAAGTAAAAPGRSGMMGGMFGGFAAGLLGAGLIGMLFGNGFMSGLGSFMGFLGLLLQVALVFFAVRWVIGYFRRRNQPATEAAGSGYARQASGPQPEWTPGAGAMAAASQAGPASPQPLNLIEADFNAFERLLGEIQTAYSNGDRTALGYRSTPEVQATFLRDLDEADRAGVTNRISNVKLLQGDLAEAWREGSSEYATVALRFQFTDVTLNKATGAVVEGDANRLDEATEIWTFVRQAEASPEAWRLSAIQQA